MPTPPDPDPIVVGRYVLHRQIARGGMATIHLAHLVGDVGFSRIVAAKRLHPELAENGEFVTMFLDEARVASKVHHRNIVPVLDLVTTAGEVVLVQEYVRGASLARLLTIATEAKSHVPVPIAASIACQVLAALHAAHDAVDEMGVALHVVHRDVTPQNIMVATDGTARLLDFGVAKAALAAHVTRKGTFKGKLAYSAPEHLRGSATHQSDIYSLSVVLWELVTGQRLHRSSAGITRIIERIMAGSVPTIVEALAEERSFMSGYRWQQLEALSPVVQKGLAADPRRRWKTAAEMEEAIAAAVPISAGADVAAWLSAAARDYLDEQERVVAEEEASWRTRPARAGSPIPTDLAIPVVGEPSGPVEAVGLAPPLRLRAVLAQVPWQRVAIGSVLACVVGLVLALALPHHKPPAAASTAPAAEPAAATDVTARPSLPAALAPARTAPTCAPVPARTVAHPGSAGPRHVARIRVAAPPRPAVKKVEKAEKLERVERPEKSEKPDCNPPYYYKGDKKIFKPACV